MAEKITLRGITWNHSRGFTPVVATAQRFCEMHPTVEIYWEKRSLQAFADEPILALADRYDLLVIDHPWAGFAAQSGALLPLQEHIPAAYLDDQARNSVGQSHVSYIFSGNQCALAIDAATPVASYRPDLLERHAVELPETWEDLLRLAGRGLVIHPGIAIDTLMNFYMMCCAYGEPPIVDGEWTVSDATALQSLSDLRDLALRCPREIINWNPIAVYETLSSRDDYAYCPFAYSYSNYAREGYARRRLVFGDMVTAGTTGRLQSTLGGTGLAISARCEQVEVAVAYAMYTAEPTVQRTLYLENGGQPGHRTAWLDARANDLTGGFFRDTLPALDRAYLRPRYPGYMHFQDTACLVVHECVMNGADPKATLAAMKRIHKESRTAQH